MLSTKSIHPSVLELIDWQTEGQTNKQTNKATKQKDYTSPALAGAGDYNEVSSSKTDWENAFFRK